MAPARAAGPRAKRGPQNLANIGVEGRATGLTVDERPRDENGLEIVENWYSSPAPLENRQSRRSNGMSTSSEDMDVALSSGPEPTEVLTSGKLARDRKSIVPLPRARSPIKTSLGATPVRGTPKTSLSPAKPQTQERVLPKSPRRLLDFSMGDSSRSAQRSDSQRSKARVNGGRPHDVTNGDVFDIPRSPSRSQSPAKGSSAALGADMTSATRRLDDFGRGNSPPPALDDDEFLDDQGQEQPELMDEALNAADQADRVPVYNAEDLEEEAEEESPGAQAEHEVLNADHGGEEDYGDHDQSTQDQPEPVPPPPKRKGRPPKNSKAPSDASQKSKQRPKPKTQSRTAKDQIVRPSRPAQRQRTQTPMDADGVQQTRFGRNSYKPLAYWKGERAVFQEHSHNQDLREIIRIEDNTPQKRPYTAKSISKRKKRNYTIFEEDQDNDDYEEPWEVSEGTVNAPVRLWDSELGVAPADSEIDQQLAFASARIQPRASPDNPNFFFTKTLTMPFFGSGVIEIPAGGHKGLKNSRKFQFIFFVHYGKVKVEVAGTPFTITKGGMWQVPRGNFYSIANDTDHPAKIFFAQSCEIVVDLAAAPPLENLDR